MYAIDRFNYTSCPSLPTNIPHSLQPDSELYLLCHLLLLTLDLRSLLQPCNHVTVCTLSPLEDLQDLRCAWLTSTSQE